MTKLVTTTSILLLLIHPGTIIQGYYITYMLSSRKIYNFPFQPSKIGAKFESGVTYLTNLVFLPDD